MDQFSKVKLGRMGKEKNPRNIFLNLEKLMYNQRTMICLIKEDGIISRNQKEILKMQAAFYSKL